MFPVSSKSTRETIALNSSRISDSSFSYAELVRWLNKILILYGIRTGAFIN